MHEAAFEWGCCSCGGGRGEEEGEEGKRQEHPRERGGRSRGRGDDSRQVALTRGW